MNSNSINMTHSFEIHDNIAYLKNNNSLNYIKSELTNKFFVGDLLDDNFDLIHSDVRSKFLVGFFSTSQTSKFGKNSKGNTLYSVTPLDMTLPNFIISYGGKLKGKIALKFKFVSWEDKLPKGEIVEVLGLFNQDNMINILLNHYNIFPKKIKIEESNYEKSISRKDLRKLELFSIDPKDCMDIDDALSIEINDDITTIGVHIAQPICWLSPDSIKKKMYYQFSTLYINEERKDLWGLEVTNKASLFEGEEKPCYSVFYHYKDNILIRTEDFPSLVINKKKLTYDNADNYKSSRLLKDFTNLLENIDDYHELVSYWMKETNKYIGIKLKDKIPYRVNRIKVDSSIVNTEEFTKDIGKILFQKNIESAYYSMTENYHTTLDVNYYCHFTSPIRRFIDSWIHFYLTYSDSIKLEIDIDRVNYLDKQTKKFHRCIELDNIYSTIFKEYNCIERIGFITDIIAINKIEVYIEDIGFLKVRLYNLKFHYLVSVEKSNNIIEIEYNGEKYKFAVGDKVELILNKLEAIIPKDKLIVELKNSINFF